MAISKQAVQDEKVASTTKAILVAVVALTLVGIAITPKQAAASQEIGITTCQKWKADTIYGDEGLTLEWLRVTSGKTDWFDSDITRFADDYCLESGNDNETMWAVSNLLRGQ